LLSPPGNNWSLDFGTASPASGSLAALVAGNQNEVLATVSCGGTSLDDTSALEISITATRVPSLSITGGGSVTSVIPSYVPRTGDWRVSDFGVHCTCKDRGKSAD